MNVLTMYFAGSGHGLSSEDDSIVVAYKKTKGAAMFIPGPGGQDANVYKKNFPAGVFIDDEEITGQNAKSTGKGSSAQKRAATGKGWNRGVFFALEGIKDYLDRKKGAVTINIAGHSRGSITVIMLLNDILHEHPNYKFTIASTTKGVKSFNPEKKKLFNSLKNEGYGDDFEGWYQNRLKKIWTTRMSNEQDADTGIANLQSVIAAKNRLSINLFLFDPVGGINQGCSSRKQDFPDHNIIKRARVLRMETGGVLGTLSTNMPKFDGWDFLTGDQSKNLGAYPPNVSRERYLIPLPGKHGAGLSINRGDGDTDYQQYIGTSYMVGLLKACNTTFEEGFTGDYGIPKKYAECYDKLYEQNVNVLPGSLDTAMGSKDRKKIHTHHTSDEDGFTGSYAGNAINAHHKHLQEIFSENTSSNPLFGK